MEGAPEKIACCFDAQSRRKIEKFKKRGLEGASSLILKELSSRGLDGATTLELGCGVGGLAVSLLKAGAGSVMGVDLSPKMVDASKALASEAGYSSSSEFLVGDGATIHLKGSDIVILDSVLCCYPDTTMIVENSSSASQKLYVLSLPDSRRPATKLLNLLLPLQSIILRGQGFRFYVPKAQKIIRQLEAKGFSLIFDAAAGFSWSVLIFAVPQRR